MDHFAGLDVSVKETSVCIVDDSGKIVSEVKVASEPEALLAARVAPLATRKTIGQVMFKTTAYLLAVAFIAFCAVTSSRAETPEEWVVLGTRVHGFFGGFIPAGIRIGLDAKERLKAEPRTLSILYYQGEKAPCPCVLDGVMLATQASPGQGTIQVAGEKAPPGLMAVIVIRDRKTGEGLRYNIGDEWLPKMLAWNKDDPLKRYDEAMKADALFTVEHLAPQ